MTGKISKLLGCVAITIALYVILIKDLFYLVFRNKERENNGN